MDKKEFWENYSEAIKVMLRRDREVIEKQAEDHGLSEEKAAQLASVDVTAKHYDSLLNEEYEKLRKRMIEGSPLALWKRHCWQH